MAASFDDAYQHCMDVVREGDRDRFLATLFVPAEKRPHIFALRAFDLEVARVRSLISEPLPGEIRLQWWRDTIKAGAASESLGHPVAAALIDTITKHDLPVTTFDRLIDARVFDLYDDPMPSLNDLEGYAGDTASSLYQLSALILDPNAASTTAEAAGHSGVVETIINVLRNLGTHLSRGQIYLPEDMLHAGNVDMDDLQAGKPSPGLSSVIERLLGKADEHLDAFHQAHMPSTVAPCFLSLSLTGRYLDIIRKNRSSLLEKPVELAQWRRQLILWNAARRGTF